jgi:hypothetical protein
VENNEQTVYSPLNEALPKTLRYKFAATPLLSSRQTPSQESCESPNCSSKGSIRPLCADQRNMIQNNFDNYISKMWKKLNSCEGTIESNNLIVIHVVKKLCFLLSVLCPSQPSSCLYFNIFPTCSRIISKYHFMTNMWKLVKNSAPTNPRVTTHGLEGDCYCIN